MPEKQCSVCHETEHHRPLCRDLSISPREDRDDFDVLTILAHPGVLSFE